MVATSFIKIFSIAALVTFLVSSVESVDCPIPKSQFNAKSEKLDTFLVMFKKGQENENKKQEQFNMLKECYDASVQSFKDKKSGVTSFSTKNVITDMSELRAYAFSMNDELASKIKKMDGVFTVEKEIVMKTQYALPSKFTRRAVDNNPEPNDDRIDQAKFPLDGKYTFPDSAGKGVNIFVVDTGVNPNHQELQGRVKSGGAFCDGCNEDDENGHGTHVSSIAAGKTLGVARNANIIAIRVLDANGSGSNVGVINGLNAVLDQHNNSKNKNSVVNMSLGGSFSDAVNEAVKQLTDAGVHVAVAAGNEAQDACKTSPASEPSAVTVGATNKGNDGIANFSNFGKCLDIFAPGVDIKGADFKNEDGTVVFSGTSQATPHVAGTLALIIAKDGNQDPAAMAKALLDLSTKDVVKGLGNNGSPNNFLRVPAP